MPLLAYCFTCKESFHIRNRFFALISISSFCCFLACMLPGANTPKWRPCRAYIFIALGLGAALPFIYTIYMPDENRKYIIDSWKMSPYVFAGGVYIGGALCYAVKFPERWFPCKFDLIG